jgi:hypothetical protein
MEMNPFLETTSRSASQEFPNILWNPEVQFLVSKAPSLLPILSQMNPVHTTPSYFTKIRFYIQLVPRSRKCGSIHPLPHAPSCRSA